MTSNFNKPSSDFNFFKDLNQNFKDLNKNIEVKSLSVETKQNIHSEALKVAEKFQQIMDELDPIFTFVNRKSKKDVKN